MTLSEKVVNLSVCHSLLSIHIPYLQLAHSEHENIKFTKLNKIYYRAGKQLEVWVL